MAITRFRQRSLAPRRYLSLLMLLLIPALIAAHRHSSVDFEHEQPQVIAYVDSGAAGPGSLGNSTDPYPSIFSAFFAGANEFRIKLGTYTESLAFGTGNHVFRTWNGSSVAEELDVPGQVTIAGTFTLGLLGVSTANLTLVGKNVTFSIESIDIHDGVLDIGETTLVLNGVGLFNFLFIRDAGTLTSIAPPGKTPQQPGLLRFSGLSRDFQFDGRVKRIPHFTVNMIPGETLFLQADGSPDEERLILEGGLRVDSGGVELLSGLDILDIGQYEQFGGEFRMAGVSSINLQRQRFIARRNMIIEHGEFHANGGDVEVLGDYCLGCTPPETKNAQPRNGLFNLGFLGTQTVVGNFTV
ncbi:MAG: hypothetical protein IH853_13665, partial [Bacteroidetes bacterium]|nr:hypothetical protein [Bacteroidota bacterium]